MSEIIMVLGDMNPNNEDQELTVADIEAYFVLYAMKHSLRKSRAGCECH